MDLFPTPDHADAKSLLLDIRLAHLFLDTAGHLKSPDRKRRFYAIVDRAIETVAHALEVTPVADFESIRVELHSLISRFRSTTTHHSSAASAG